MILEETRLSFTKKRSVKLIFCNSPSSLKFQWYTGVDEVLHNSKI